MKINKFIQYISIIFFILCFLFLGIILAQSIPYSFSEKSEPIKYEAEYFNGTDWISYNSNTNINANKTPDLKVKINFTENVLEKKQISFQIKWIEVHIFQNEEEVFSYGTTDTLPYFMKSGGVCWKSISTENFTDNTMVIVFHNPYKNNYSNTYDLFLKSLSFNNLSNIQTNLWQKSVIPFCLSFTFIFMGIFVCITSCIMIKKKHPFHISILSQSIFMTIAGMWMFFTSQSICFLIPSPCFIATIQTLVLCLIPLAFEEYIGCFLNGFLKTIINYKKLSSIALTLLFFILTFTKVMDVFSFRFLFSIFSLIISLAFLITILVLSIKNREKIEKTEKLALISLCIMYIFTTIESINTFVNFSPRGLVLLIGILAFIVLQIRLSFAYIQRAIMRMYKITQVEKEITEKNMQLVISQLQPHFVFNALNTIEYLCEINVPLAEKTIIDFSNYLRGNLQSIKTKTSIPFIKEIEHLKSYIAIEKIRFENLQVEFDIKADNFYIPPLTIQPLVENSIKHGLIYKKENGKVTISSYQTKDNFIIKIQDNGIGFSIFLLKTKANAGINSVKEKLKLMSNGELSIESKENQGTTVLITLPKLNNQGLINNQGAKNENIGSR